MSAEWRRLAASLNFAVGLAGAGVYWLAAQLWPTSIAVVLAMLATVLCTAGLNHLALTGARAERGLGDDTETRVALESGPGSLSGQRSGRDLGSGSDAYSMFLVLIKYNALMALSSARSPLALPEHLTLGWIMISGHAASRALVVSVMATHAPAGSRVGAVELGVSLLLGLAPAALLGIPGLIGLAAAIAARQGLCAYVLPRITAPLPERLDFTQRLTEICFYLGALAAWKYV
jgi:cobalamin synthase